MKARITSFELMGPDQGTAPGLPSLVCETLESSGGRLTRRCLSDPFEFGARHTTVRGLSNTKTDLLSGRASICGGSSVRIERWISNPEVGGSIPPRRIRGSGRVTAPTGVGSSRDRARRHRSRLACPFGPQTKNATGRGGAMPKGPAMGVVVPSMVTVEAHERRGEGTPSPQRKPREGRLRATGLPFKPSFAALPLLNSLLVHALARGRNRGWPRAATDNAFGRS